MIKEIYRVCRIQYFERFSLSSSGYYRNISSMLKDPSQPPPFSMPSKLLILHDEMKSYCFTVSCVPEVCFIIFSSFTVISLISTCSE